MAQLISVAFFVLAVAGASAALVAMLRGEWGRVSTILAGGGLAQARAHAGRPVRVRQKAWTTAQPRRAPPLRAVA